MNSRIRGNVSVMLIFVLVIISPELGQSRDPVPRVDEREAVPDQRLSTL